MKQLTDVRQREITTCAAKLFFDKGYDATSIHDIATAVGLAKATIYHYFPSKHLILFAIHRRYAGELIERHDKRSRKEPDMSPVTALRHVIHDILDTVEEHGDLTRIFFQHYSELPRNLRTAARKERDKYFNIVCTLIASGQDQQLLRKVDPKLAALALFGMCNWSQQWYRPTGAWSPDDVAETFWTIYGTGLVANDAP